MSAVDLDLLYLCFIISIFKLKQKIGDVKVTVATIVYVIYVYAIFYMAKNALK